MAGRTEAEAYSAFLDPLQRAISCVCDAVPLSTGYRQRAQPHAITLSGNPVPLRGQYLFALSLFHYYRLVDDRDAGDPRRPWNVLTTGYAYAFKDTAGQELLAYHWHPEGASLVTFPHLHLGPVARVGSPPLSRAHLPTRHVAIEDVLRLGIVDLGVEPRRADWETVLAATSAAYDRPPPR